MVLTVLCCKAAAVCVAFWLLLVIEFYIARIAYCMFLTVVLPELKYSKAKMLRTSHK